MLEQWRDIPGWAGFYQVSHLGRVRSLDRIVPHPSGASKRKGQILRAAPCGLFGHLSVNLHKDGIGQSKLVHRLVALVWIGPCPVGQQVRHGPAGVSDNSVGNLCYGTPHEDGLDKRRDGTHTGRAVRRSDGKVFISQAVAAEESNCRAQSIWRVCNGGRKTTGGYGWEYAE